MAMDFPSSPALDQKFTSGGIVYTWNGYAWSGGGLSNAVQKSGDTMSGALTAPAVNLTAGGGLKNINGVGGFTTLLDGSNNPGLHLGGTIDLTNYYRNTNHRFENRDGSFAYGIFSSIGLQISATTPSTSPTTGALTVAGGVGVGGTINVGAFPLANGPGVIAVGYANTQYGLTLRPSADNAFPIQFYNAAGTAVGYISTSSVSTSYITSSDGRLKDDVKAFDSGAMIDHLEAVDFRWKSTGERDFGVIAQDAVKAVPQACHYDEQADQWGVDYSKFVPLLLAEMKALRRRVAELEGRT